jgi:hypothetical protein
MNINAKMPKTGSGNRWGLNHLVRDYCPRPAVLALVLAGVVGLLGMANTAQALTLYQTGFETHPFVVNQPLVGQDGWTGAVPAPPFSLNPEFAIITDALARRGHQSVEVRGADLIPSGGPTAPYDAVGSYRRPVSYTLSGENTLARVDADLRLGTTQPKTDGEFFSLTIAARSGDGETLGEIGLSSGGIVEAWDFGAPPGSTPKFTTTIRLNKWYHITMLLDFAHHTTTYFINEHRLGKISTPSASNILLRGGMAVYARPDGDPLTGPTSVRSDYTARFDNFRISVHKDVPDIN